MPDSQAVMALKSLSMYPKEKVRRELAEMNFDGDLRDAVWVLDDLANTYEVREWIVNRNPNSRRFFKPLSTMPMWKQKVGKNALKFSKLGYYFIV